MRVKYENKQEKKGREMAYVQPNIQRLNYSFSLIGLPFFRLIDALSQRCLFFHFSSVAIDGISDGKNIDFTTNSLNV